jgi:multiple sugar transport system substrate-binding protein
MAARQGRPEAGVNVTRSTSRSTKILFALATMLVVSFALAQTRITMWTFLDPSKANPAPREVALKQMLDEFHADNPDVQVVVEPQDFAIMPTKFFLGHQTGQNPDVVWIDHQNLGGLLQSEAGANLNELLLNSWPAGASDDFYVQAGWMAGVDAAGVHRAVPLIHGTTSLYYRKDLFAEHGIDPASIRTWDDLIDVAKRLTLDTDGDGRIDVWGLGIPLKSEKTEVTPGYTAFVASTDATFDLDTCSPAFVNDAGVRALNLDADFVRLHRVTPTEAFVQNVDDITEQFTAGRYAIAVASALRFTGMQAVASFGGENLGLLPWPAWTSEEYPGPTVVNGWFAAVWEDSPNPEAAARWLEFMVSPRAVELWSTVGGQVPLRSSVMAQPVFNEPANAHMQVLRSSWGSNSFLLPTSCNVRTLQADWNTAVQEVVQGGADPLRALEGAARRVRDAQAD